LLHEHRTKKRQPRKPIWFASKPQTMPPAEQVGRVRLLKQFGNC
jgi:hypothetical protein